MFVQRNEDGLIVGLYQNAQPGLAEEWVEDAELPPVKYTRKEVERKRLLAYSDPITGSDRYFAEAVRLQAMAAPKVEVDVCKSAGAKRYAQIQAELPWDSE